MTKKEKQELAAYLRSSIEDYEERIQVALNVINAMHYPLRVASPVLYGQMDDAAREWAEENGVKLGVEFDKEVPDERFIFSDQPLSEQEMDSLPKVLYFHIPLPVEKIQPSHNTLSNEEKEKAQSEYNDEYQRLMNQIRLKELDYISSAGLRVLLVAMKAMNKQGEMKLVSVGETVRDILDVTGFSDILTIE